MGQVFTVPGKGAPGQAAKPGTEQALRTVRSKQSTALLAKRSSGLPAMLLGSPKKIQHRGRAGLALHFGKHPGSTEENAGQDESSGRTRRQQQGRDPGGGKEKLGVSLCAQPQRLKERVA